MFIIIATYKATINSLVNLNTSKIIIVYNLTIKAIKILKKKQIGFIYKCKNTVNFIGFFKSIVAALTAATAFFTIASNTNFVKNLFLNY